MFRARKTRERKAPDPVGVGKPLVPSAAVRVWYEKELNSVVSAMVAEYREKVKEVLEHPEVQAFYAQDAAANSAFNNVLKALNKKWTSVFKGFSAKIAPEFVDKVDVQSKSSTFASLSAAGVEQPRSVYNSAVSNTLAGSVDFNSTLITNLQQETHEALYAAIMLSVTSPNPEEQGASGIQNALAKAGITAKKRVALITRDQTSKVFASLATERLRQNGIEHFRWLHSSAGKVPRQTHLDHNGEVYTIDDPRLWEGPKADQGPPGWAINCRCRMIPLIGYGEDDDED